MITEAQARAECRRWGLNPDDWREDHGQPRVYLWQDVRCEMEAMAQQEEHAR